MIEPGATVGRPSRVLMVLVAGVFFMENLDATIVSTAAPAMARTFGVDPAGIGVTVTAYLVTVAAFIPASGWVSERWGPRRSFVAAVVVFTVGSVLCAFAPTLTALVAARVVQAAGGAMMVPIGRLAVYASTDRSDLIRVIAWLTWPALLAPVLAPLVGGVVVTYLSWHWIFLLNLPLGAAAVAAGWRVVPRPRAAMPRPLDGFGLATSVLALAALVYAASTSATEHPYWPAVIMTATTGVLVAVICVRHLLRTAAPLLALDPLRTRTFRTPHAGGSLFRAAVSAVPFLLALELQNGFGWSPVRAGAVVTFVFVGNLTIKPATTTLLRRWGFRTVLLGAIGGSVAALAAIALLGPHSPEAVLAVVLVLGGMTRSVGFTAYNTMAMADIEPARITSASTLATSLQQLAQGAGVTLAIVALRLAQIGSGHGDGAIDTYRLAYLVVAVVCAGALTDALRLDRSAGSALLPGRTGRNASRTTRDGRRRIFRGRAQ